MKVRYVFLACLLCLPIFSVALSQSKPVFEKKAELVLEDANDRIVAQKFLSNGRLLLVSKQKVQVFDRIYSKLLESRPIATADFCEDKDRVISPNSRWMLVFGNYGCTGKKAKIKRPPAIWDMETGKQIAVLDKTSKPVRAALWSSNGKTLVTSSDTYYPNFFAATSVEISFWDGQTFEFKNSLPSDKINWFHLTSDGDRCIYSVAPIKTIVLLLTYISETGGPIGVWNISRGQIEQTISLDAKAGAKISAANISPDETLITFLGQPAKSKAIERKLMVWKLDEDNTHKYEMKYEIKAASKPLARGAMFSPDGKYFALKSNKNLQIYDSTSGQQKSEMAVGDRYPTEWLDDNRILLFVNGDEMEARETATGKQLYEHKVVYSVAEYTGDDGTPNYFTEDQTEVVVHPTMNVFLTYSEQYIEIYDSRSGEILQTVVSPPMDYSKKKPRLSDKEIVSKAGWSNDGLTLYFVSHDKRSISLWRRIE